MLPKPARGIRCLLAALMLLTGLLGQAGHAAAHASGEASPEWQAALQAEHAWLAGEANAGATVELFGGGGHHHHGPAHHHDGAGDLVADHAHGVVFLAPSIPALGPPNFGACIRWSLASRLVTGEASQFDRPPRGAAMRA